MVADLEGGFSCVAWGWVTVTAIRQDTYRKMKRSGFLLVIGSVLCVVADRICNISIFVCSKPLEVGKTIIIHHSLNLLGIKTSCC